MSAASLEMSYDWSLRASLMAQLVVSICGMITNGAVLSCLSLRSQMRTQPNFLVANLSTADFLVCFFFFSWATMNLFYEMRPSIPVCMYIMAPVLFALNVSLCCSVAVTHHRSTCCLLGYRTIHGVPNIAERWQLIAASVSVWLFTFMGGAAAYLDIGADGAVPICIYPAALQNSYLVPFAMFTCCVAGVIVLEHLRVLIRVTYYCKKRDPTDNGPRDKPNPLILRCTFLLLILFIGCWMPLNYISYLYLKPSGTVYQEYYYKLAQWLCSLPLIHTALIDPVVYALSEKEYTDTLACALLALCPFGMRWKLKWKLRKLDIFHRRKRNVPPPNDPGNETGVTQSDQKEIAKRDRPYAITADVIEMDQLTVDVLDGRVHRNGHVNFAYHSEYM